MEVKPGYKMTEVGVIPEDWECKEIGGEIDLLTGHPFPSVGYAESGVRLLRGANVKRGNTSWDTAITQFWPSVDLRIAKYELQAGDLVISMDGSLVGRSYAQLTSIDLPALLLQRVARIRSTKLDTTYLAAFVGSDRFVKYIDSVKTATAIPHINSNDIRKFTIPVPSSLSEQRAIANALSDVDALLDGLERLIAKKRDIKQATMQQLLTGQTRLPGYEGEWETKRLGEILTICHGKSQSDVESADGAYPILASGGKIGTASHWLYNKPSVLIGRKGTIDQPQFMGTPFWTVDTLFYSAMHGNNSAKYFYYRFCLIDWMRYNEASGVPSLNARTIEQIEVAIPEPIEQTAIAAILSDMDAELQTLEKRRDKTRQLKQAMMQELMTGKTRLI